MYNFGIIGTGFISSNLCDAIKLVDNANAYAIYSRSEETGQKFKADNGVEVVYTDLDLMLADDEIKIVYVASPNNMHFNQAIKAIEAGKHVLIEKPITLLSDQIDKLYKLAKKQNVLVMEAYVALPYNTFNTVKEWIGTIGEIGKVDFHYQKQTRHFDAYCEGKHVNVFDGKMGGGALRDLGPYTIYPLVSWFGSPMQTHYFNTKNDTNADETTMALAHYETFSATITNSKIFADNRPNIISGEDGYIEFDNINGLEHVKLYDVHGNLQKEETSTYKHRMEPEVTHMIKCIEQGLTESPLYTKQLAKEVTAIISENYRK